MKRNWLHGLGGSLIAISLLSAGGALAQEEGFNNWDADGSGTINFEEWYSGFDEKGFFDRWDANDDNRIDEQEYRKGIYDTYDRDGSGGLSDGEADDAYGNYTMDDAGDEGFWDI